MTGGEGGPAAGRAIGPHLAAAIRRGPWPANDGWLWLYRCFDAVAPPGSGRRRALCRLFWPRRWERASARDLYGALGVGWFGRMIPTGGITVRRLTRLRMAAYTLRGSSLGAARDFYYRTCVFESLHMPFLLALVALAVRQLARGRLDLAIEDMLVNLLFNVYPILHHRRTRGRIVDLLSAAARVRSGGWRDSRGAGQAE